MTKQCKAYEEKLKTIEKENLDLKSKLETNTNDLSEPYKSLQNENAELKKRISRQEHEHKSIVEQLENNIRALKQRIEELEKRPPKQTDPTTNQPKEDSQDFFGFLGIFYWVYDTLRSWFGLKRVSTKKE